MKKMTAVTETKADKQQNSGAWKREKDRTITMKIKRHYPREFKGFEISLIERGKTKSKEATTKVIVKAVARFQELQRQQEHQQFGIIFVCHIIVNIKKAENLHNHFYI